MNFRLGSLVRYRNRTWVLADREGNLLSLRPLGGHHEDLLPVRLDLLEALREALPHEDLAPSTFPPPPPSPWHPPRSSASSSRPPGFSSGTGRPLCGAWGKSSSA